MSTSGQKRLLIRIAVITGGGSIVGVVAWLLLPRLLEIEPYVVLLLAGLLIGLGDLWAAWDNERATERGDVEPRNTLTGKSGRVVSPFAPGGGQYVGRVEIGAESWNARSSEQLAVGAEVRVVDREGLTLIVQRSG